MRVLIKEVASFLSSFSQRTATEVTTLLGKSETMQASGHTHSQELRELTSELRSLHSNFESRFVGRKKLLEATIQFYKGASEVRRGGRERREREKGREGWGQRGREISNREGK